LLNPQPHHRERLATIFWEEASTHASRKNLSQTLWRLRQALQSANVPMDDYLIVDRECVSFNTSSVYWLDTEVFERTVTRYQGISGGKLTLEQAQELEDVVALFTGDLLEGIYEDWCLYDRERFSMRYLDTLGKLMIFHEANKTYKQGIMYGEHILSYDNTHERVHQQMMRLYWLSGNRNAALAQYKCCLQILRDALKAAPMPETTQLYQQMLHDQFQPDDDPGYHRGTALSPLVRSDESLQNLAEQSLLKISHLQRIIQETSAELSSLERLIRTALLDSEEP
jgi:DNA-binding SARP family transcriptional activator